MSNNNLISLGDRSLEERKKIARLGGLARQEQRRKQIAMKKTLEGMLNADAYINKYVKNPKYLKTVMYNSKNTYKYSFNLFSVMYEDIQEANRRKEVIEEKELIKRKKKLKKQRKKINRRYYLKKKKQKEKK